MTYKIHTLGVKIPSSNFLYPTVTMVTKKKTDGLQVDCNKRFYFQYEASEELNFAMYVMYHLKIAIFDCFMVHYIGGKLCHQVINIRLFHRVLGLISHLGR